MVAKISPRHRQTFLEALAETGNYVIPATQVRVSRDWAFRLRRRHAVAGCGVTGAVESSGLKPTFHP